MRRECLQSQDEVWPTQNQAHFTYQRFGLLQGVQRHKITPKFLRTKATDYILQETITALHTQDAQNVPTGTHTLTGSHTSGTHFRTAKKLHAKKFNTLSGQHQQTTSNLVTAIHSRTNITLDESTKNVVAKVYATALSKVTTERIISKVEAAITGLDSTQSN